MNLERKFPRLSRIVTILVVLFMFAGLYIVLRAFFLIVQFELKGPLSEDSSLYLAIGRGMLNGLVPYRDLFETKPPGIFFLSSLALLIGDDTKGAGLLQSIALAGIPIVLVIHTWLRSRDGRSRWFIVTLAGMIGTLIALFARSRAGEFQVESFGAFFGTLYAVAIDVPEFEWTISRLLLATVGILGAIGMKEPFFFSTLATALLLCHSSPRTFWQRFVMPLLLGALVGACVLQYLGYLQAYLTNYLPEILFRFGVENHAPWKRVATLATGFKNFWNFSAPLASLILATGISSAWLLFKNRRKSSPSKLVLGSLFLGVAPFLLALSGLLGNTSYTHHYVSASPGYVAVALLLVDLIRNSPTPMLWFVTLVVSSACLRFSDYQIKPYTPVSSPRRAAEKIDAILDSCGQDRYFFVGWNGRQPYAFTKHSPLGPAFIQYDFYLDSNREDLRDSFVRNLHSAFLTVQKVKAESDAKDVSASQPLKGIRLRASQYMAKNLTAVPPSCAAALPYERQEGGYEYLFHK